MHVAQQPTGPNLFKASLLAWRASYLATKTPGAGTETGTPGIRNRVLKARPRRPAVRR
jgi:hypothetical protein